jgi:hypothetical protein
MLAHFTGGDVSSALLVLGLAGVVSGLRARRWRRAGLGAAATLAGIVAGFLHR